MKIALGADRADFGLEEELREALQEQEHEVIDFGTNGPTSTDYPVCVSPVGQAVPAGSAERDIPVWATGVGMSIAANQLAGIRGAPAVNEDEVRLTRAHNDATVLTIGPRYTDLRRACALIDTFLSTPFEGGRRARSAAKTASLERAPGA